MTRPLSPAERQRRCRARKSAGKIRLVVETDEIDLIGRLTEAGFLKPGDVNDHGKVVSAMLAVIASYCHA